MASRRRRLLKRLPVVAASDLSPGDILLTSLPLETQELGRVHPGMVRNVVATQQGGYFSQTLQHVPGWNRVSVIASTRDGTLCAVTASVQGLEVYPLRDRLLHLHGKGAQVAVRRLNLHSPSAGRKITECCQRLLGVALGGCLWSDLEWKVPTAPIAEEGDGEGKGDDGEAEAKGVEPVSPRVHHPTSSDATELVQHLLPRVLENATQMPPQAKLEVYRTFNRFDINKDGKVETSEVRAVLRDLRGSYVSKGQARRFMQLLDKNSDGVLTLEEFSKAIARRAKGTIPIEHDLGEIVSAEFVALALRWMGLLPTQRRESKRLLLSSLAVSIHVPQSPIKGGQQLKPDTLSTVEHFTPTSFSSAQVSPPLVLAGAELGTEHMVAVSIREEA